MGNDIEIRVSVANNSAAGITAVNASLNRLRDAARDAGRGLDGLTARATAATVALRALKDSAQDASRALRSLNTAARNADGRLSTMSDRSRTLRSDTDDLDGSMRRLTTTMGGLGGSNGTIQLNNAGNSMNGLRKAALLLSPALVPIAAAAVPIATSLGAAAVAVGAFGLAVAGQVSVAQSAADAQGKYTAAVQKNGAASQQAAQAQNEWLSLVQTLDPETRKAGAAMQVFNDATRQWSKDLAGSTMPVFTKGMAALGGLLPQMAPLVRSTSTELDRLVTVLAGGINSDGFSRFMSSFSEFSSGVLSRATDSLVRFMRTAQGGVGSSQLSEFMAYVKEVGPQVGQTLSNLGQALAHLVAASSDTGVSLLTVVNALAELVNAIPTGALSSLLQFVVVFKAVKMAALGLGGAGGALAGFGAQLAAMQAASVAAGGGLSGLAAGFGALSRATKVALIGSGIGILVVALSQLSQMGKKTPADIDKLTSSMRSFATGGVVGGEAARAFGKDLSGLAESLQKVKDPKGLDQVQQSIVSFFGTDSTPVKDAKENIDALDKSLANLVKNGQADLAASALDNITAQMKKQGFSSKDVTSQLDDYKAALADQAFEQKLAAQAMGLFGDQALAVQSKLDAQKQSADGLRQAIQALNDVNRAGLGGMIGFEAAIDNAAKAAKDNAGALSMSGGVLNLNSEKARNAASALQDLADKTDEAAGAARESGSSWETVNGIYTRGRAALIKNAEAMGLSKTQAAALADQILKIPNKTATIKMNAEDAKRDIASFNAAVKKTPGSKSVTLSALSKSGEQVLESFGLKVKRLPNGKVKVTTAAGGALSAIANVAAALARLDGNTASTYVNTIVTTTKRSVHEVVGATGGLYTGSRFRYADGGLVEGPGTGTSDDIPAPWLSNGEFVIKKAAVDKYGEAFLQRVNDGQIDGARYAKGGKVSQATKDARNQLSGSFGISHFGRMAGYSNDPFEKSLGSPADVGSLVSALNGVRGEIKAAFSGGKESSLLKRLDSAGKALIGYEKKLTSVNKSLDSARSKLDSLRDSSAQLSGSVKGGVLSSANITQGVSADTPTTVASIMGGLTASRDKATAFSGALAGLRKKGLSASLLQQIAEAGVGGGGLETAGALMSASSSEISSLNSLQKQVGAAAASAGKTTADAVYAGQIKAQAELVHKLDAQQNKLIKAMDKLAASMEKVLQKALKGKAAGGIVGAAAAGGMRGGLTWVGEHEPELLDLPVGSRVWSGPDSRRKALAAQAPWASMLNTPRGTSGGRYAPTAAVSGGGGGQPLVIQLQIGKREFGQVWIDVGRNEVRSRGGIEAALKPPRGK